MFGLGSIAARIFGSSNDRLVKDFMSRVQKINALEEKYAALSDDDIAKLEEELSLAGRFAKDGWVEQAAELAKEA